MINARALVRAAVKGALTDPVDGFNANFAAIAAAYGVTAYGVNFAAGSPDFVQSYLDPAAVEISRFLRTPLGMTLYTSSAVDGGGERSKTSAFDGTVVCNIDVFLRFDEGIEDSEEDTEAYADAVEDATLQAIHSNAAAFTGGPVHYNYEFSCSRDPIVQTEAGYEQRVAMQFIFSVVL